MPAPTGTSPSVCLPFAGIGPWTVAYIRMRALGDPDAFLPSDLGVRRALEARGLPGDPRNAASLAESWRPWRSYALQYLWSGPMSLPTSTGQPTPNGEKGASGMTLTGNEVQSRFRTADEPATYSGRRPGPDRRDPPRRRRDGRRELRLPGTWRRWRPDLRPALGPVRRSAEAVEQLKAYFAGELTNFDLPLVLTGTAFQRRVWWALADIPYGRTESYGSVATRVGNPKASRAVGMANNKNPIPIVLPCHRVIGANGQLVGYGGGLWMKEWLLRHEQAVAERGGSSPR